MLIHKDIWVFFTKNVYFTTEIVQALYSNLVYVLENNYFFAFSVSMQISILSMLF